MRTILLSLIYGDGQNRAALLMTASMTLSKVWVCTPYALKLKDYLEVATKIGRLNLTDIRSETNLEILMTFQRSNLRITYYFILC